MDITENTQLLKKLDSLVIKCIREYNVISDGDKILIGLSGGKDSLALTQLLAERRKIHAPKFDIAAIHIRNNEVGYKSDIEYLQNFCNNLGVELHIKDISIDFSTDHRKSPCFLCSWHRRKAMFEFAKANGFNCIALGHHKDDIITTLLMNISFQGSFSSMPPYLKMDKFNLAIIRPMALIEEKQIQKLADSMGYIIQQKSCKFEKSSFRKDTEKIISDLEKLNSNVKSSIWKSMENIMPNYLPQKNSTKNSENK